MRRGSSSRCPRLLDVLRDDFLAEARRQPDIGAPLNRAADALSAAALGRGRFRPLGEVAAELIRRIRPHA